MDRVEAYADYRQFLRDFYEDRKQRSKSFSHRQFCQKAGLTSPSFLKEVIDGKRNLTDVSISQFIQGLGLTDIDAAFFGALVRFNQAMDPASKQQYLDRMRELRRKVHAAVVPLDRYDYYSKWHHPVLRELAVHRIWNDDGTTRSVGLMFSRPSSARILAEPGSKCRPISLLKTSLVTRSLLPHGLGVD